MHDDGAELRNRMDHCVLHVLCYAVPFGNRQLAVDGDAGFCVNRMTDPAGTDKRYINNAGHTMGGMLRAVKDLGFDRVHQPSPHLLNGALKDKENRHRDGDPNEGVRLLEAEPDSRGAEQYGDRSEPVGSGMIPVCNQGSATDSFTNADPILRNRFIAYEAQQPGHGHPAEVIDLGWIYEAADGLVPGYDRRCRDHQNDKDARQVLRSPVTEGIVPAGCPTRKGERDPEWDRRNGVTEIMNSVREECDGPADEDDDHLHSGRRPEAKQGQLYGPDAFRGALKRGIDAIGRVVAMRAEDDTKKPPNSRGVGVIAARRGVLVGVIVIL